MPATGSNGGGADRPRPTAIVAIGASAGGLEAFRALVGALPADGGIAYVLLSHLSPSHPSLLPQILARETTLPVTSARDGLPVEPDHVYLLPPGAFLEIEDGVLRLEPYDERREVRTPIDRFFTSLAKDAERRAVGIVLSGSGSDGALGVIAIRDAGGMTIAQKPETAAHEGMSRSAIAGDAIDLVLEVAEIPARLAEHVRQLDTLGRATASPDHAKRFDLATTVRETVEDQRIQIESGGVALELELPPEPLDVEADPSRIAQAVGNLLENARKFTEAGGRIGVRVAPSGDGESAVVVVADTGVGMAPETIAQLFEPFPHVTGKNPRGEPGLGLGLALVKALIEDQGGSVAARSDGPDRGSEFGIRLPLAEPGPPAEAEIRGNGDTAEPVPRRILLVEDEPDAAESMKLMLELSGHRVRLARDGAAAIAAATAEPPDVLLCDIGLPGELDGYGVAAALRSEPDLRSVFFVALTGFGRAPDRRRALGAGFDVHLTKPVDPAELERLLRAARRP